MRASVAGLLAALFLESGCGFFAVKLAPKKTARRSDTQLAVKARSFFRESLAAKDKKAAEAKYRETVAFIDKAIHKGALHANTAARYKSRLAARLNSL